MFSKAKKTERIDAEQREQYEYARRRINQKKNLMRHFILFFGRFGIAYHHKPHFGIWQ